MAGQWCIGLDAWVIQDGNYPDFEVGQHAEFAVEFYPGAPELVEAGSATAKLVDDDSKYDIRARVVTVREDAWVVDCGELLVFQEARPPMGIQVNDWIECSAGLGVDPFEYFEVLAKKDDMPALIYSWSIDGIHRQTAPLIPTSERTLERDPTKLGWMPLSRTDAWHDDDGHGSYRLLCTLLDVPPKRRSATAT